MHNLRIKEAIRLHNIINADNLRQTDIAVKIWPKSSLRVARINMYRLSSGKRCKVNPEWVRIISESTGISTDYILGIRDDAYYKKLLKPAKKRK